MHWLSIPVCFLSKVFHRSGLSTSIKQGRLERFFEIIGKNAGHDKDSLFPDSGAGANPENRRELRKKTPDASRG
jgi:hypothetical protein